MTSLETNQLDLKWMTKALGLANEAQAIDEVPVGALIIQNDQIIGQGYNSLIKNNDPTAHAEIIAIREACKKSKNYRLPNSTLYVTLEPCSMCAGAIVHSRIDRVVISTREPRAGAGGSVFNLLDSKQMNHQCKVEFGLMADESSHLLKSFFKRKR